MPAVYPLRFDPFLKRYLWGGRRLQSVLGKKLGPENDYGESWEISDHPNGQCRIANGPAQGTIFGDYFLQHSKELLGRHYPQPRFPLLVKFLDAQENLSLQVHPNDQLAGKLTPPDNGKTESWFILESVPGSVLYAGLKAGVDRPQFETTLREARGADLVHQLQPKVGDCLHLPAGAVHALGKGILAAEVQQSSDVTYRLFDWNRPDASGKLRPLHIDQGLEAVDFSLGPIAFQTPQPTQNPYSSRIVSSDKFLVDRWEIDETVQLGGDDRFHILLVLEGALQLSGDPESEPLRKGETCLLPAALGTVSIEPVPECQFLEMYLP